MYIPTYNSKLSVKFTIEFYYKKKVYLILLMVTPNFFKHILLYSCYVIMNIYFQFAKLFLILRWLGLDILFCFLSVC